MITLSDRAKELLKGPNFAHLATLMPDGSPQVTPMWVDLDGSHIIMNTAIGRVKHRNVGRDTRVAIEVPDPKDPYRYVAIQGRVVEVTEQGADASIDALAKKYLGLEAYPWRSSKERRVILRIAPERETAN